MRELPEVMLTSFLALLRHLRSSFIRHRLVSFGFSLCDVDVTLRYCSTYSRVALRILSKRMKLFGRLDVFLTSSYIVIQTLVIAKCVDGFAIHQTTPIALSRGRSARVHSTVTDEATGVAIDPKDAVKLFGRLAEKYIMLDASGGMCCYSACSDCEYRAPGGGYIMADQSSSRPKWIPVYEHRLFESSGKEHTSKWSAEIFKDGPAITKDEFLSLVTNLAYAPPLGGPYVSASSADIDDVTIVERLFDVLVAEGKSKLTKHRMGLRMRELSSGEEGLTWAAFLAALNGGSE